MSPVRLGVAIFLNERTIAAAEMARAAEAHGFESLWLPEHTHIPVSRLSPFPAGGELPDHYRRLLDPFVALGVAAAVTSMLRLATGITLVAQRDPIVTAKEVATLDVVSGGRAVFGVGAGWNREEMENHGGDFDTRFALLRERVEAMKVLWTEDEASYHGRYVDFDPVWSWPKPVQRPYPPIVVGGSGPSALRRVVAYGDEWMPIGGTAPHEERIAELQELAAEAGRGPLRVGLFRAPTDPAELERLAALGVSRFVFVLPSVGTDEVLAELRALAPLVEHFAG
jgi:probable F420-dependent oxidoreductase